LTFSLIIKIVLFISFSTLYVKFESLITNFAETRKKSSSSFNLAIVQNSEEELLSIAAFGVRRIGEIDGFIIEDEDDDWASSDAFTTTSFNFSVPWFG
jgi:hypothetical protein